MADKVVVYTAPMTMGVIAEWAINELNVPHELKILDFANKEHKGDAYLKVNPFGKVPAIIQGDITMSESGAICLYLQRKYGPPLADTDEAHLLQWVLFGCSTLEHQIFMKDREKVEALLGPLNSYLEGKEFLVADRFTVADVVVAGHLIWGSTLPELLAMTEKFPEVDRYCKSIMTRPVCPFNPANQKPS